MRIFPTYRRQWEGGSRRLTLVADHFFSGCEGVWELGRVQGLLSRIDYCVQYYVKIVLRERYALHTLPGTCDLTHTMRACQIIT